VLYWVAQPALLRGTRNHGDGSEHTAHECMRDPTPPSGLLSACPVCSPRPCYANSMHLASTRRRRAGRERARHIDCVRVAGRGASYGRHGALRTPTIPDRRMCPRQLTPSSCMVSQAQPLPPTPLHPITQYRRPIEGHASRDSTTARAPCPTPPHTPPKSKSMCRVVPASSVKRQTSGVEGRASSLMPQPVASAPLPSDSIVSQSASLRSATCLSRSGTDAFCSRRV